MVPRIATDTRPILVSRDSASVCHAAFAAHTCRAVRFSEGSHQDNADGCVSRLLKGCRVPAETSSRALRFDASSQLETRGIALWTHWPTRAAGLNTLPVRRLGNFQEDHS